MGEERSDPALAAAEADRNCLPVADQHAQSKHRPEDPQSGRLDRMSANPIPAFQTSLDCATSDEIQNYFAGAMKDLFCLAFLLTAHADRAEKCVIRSIRECMKSTRILRKDLHAWVRNTVIRQGIALTNQESMSWTEEKDSIPVLPSRSQSSAGAEDYSSGILELSNFDRLVYVICVLEQYSSRHCALLLHCSSEEVREAHTRAVAQIAEFKSRWHQVPKDFAPDAKGSTLEPEFSVDAACGSLLD